VVRTAEDNGDDEERTGEVTPERNEPMQEHAIPGELALKGRDGSELQNR
jgi:hypothetical protein